jgi:hypothetical protein
METNLEVQERLELIKKRELKGYRLLLRVASLRNCAILTKTTHVETLIMLKKI